MESPEREEIEVYDEKKKYSTSDFVCSTLPRGESMKTLRKRRRRGCSYQKLHIISQLFFHSFIFLLLKWNVIHQNQCSAFFFC